MGEMLNHSLSKEENFGNYIYMYIHIPLSFTLFILWMYFRLALKPPFQVESEISFKKRVGLSIVKKKKDEKESR